METQGTILSLSWGQGKGASLEDSREEVTFEQGLDG